MKSIPDDRKYIGNELIVFHYAVHWKRYFGYKLSPYITGDVLEVGAGLGVTSSFLCNSRVLSWKALEPDSEMAELCRQQPFYRDQTNCSASVYIGILSDIPVDQNFDTIVYIDVLEHIEDDKGELRLALKRLRVGGHIVVLSPAFNKLTSVFDYAVGHYRRYTERRFQAITPAGLKLVRSFYLDSFGILTSIANRLFLRVANPTIKQIKLWDTVFVPLSRVTDLVAGPFLGRSVVGVWRNAL